MTPEAFTILGDEGIDADFTADSTTVHVNSPVQFTDRSLGLIESWEWDFDNDGTTDATERNPVHSYPAAGIYSVKLSVSDGSNTQTELKTEYITVLSPVGTEEINPVKEFILYPNPASSSLNISYAVSNSSNITIALYTSGGMKVKDMFEGKVDKGRYHLSTDNHDLPPGIYFIGVHTARGSITKKFVIH